MSMRADSGNEKTFSPSINPNRYGLLDNQMYGWGRNQDEFVFELIPDHFMFK